MKVAFVLPYEEALTISIAVSIFRFCLNVKAEDQGSLMTFHEVANNRLIGTGIKNYEDCR